MQTPFIKKVKKILEDPENTDIICWNDDKTMIQIRNQKLFEQKILSRNFRHNRISSFIRQLNLYGFKKIRSAQNRTFTHPLLQKGFPLDVIINKKNKSNNPSTNDLNQQSVHLEHGLEKQAIKIDCQTKKQQIFEHRISSNLFSNNRENEKQQKLQFSTTNIIAAPEQPFNMNMNMNMNMNTIWLLPVSSLSQEESWKFPFFASTPDTQIKFNYNGYTNWF